MAYRDPALMTRTEHRDEALRLMGVARSPQGPGRAPRSPEAINNLLLSAQLHLSLSTHPDTREDPPAGERPKARPVPFDPTPADLPAEITNSWQLYMLPLQEDLWWETALGWRFRWDDDRAAFRIAPGEDCADFELMYWDRVTMSQEFTSNQYPIRLHSVPGDQAFPETDEYLSGWSHAMMMRLLHDRIPGFAIVHPRDTYPFEANKEVLAEYGITDRAGMIAVAHAPHGSPHAHPRKIN